MGGGNIHTKDRIWTDWIGGRWFRVEVGTTFVGVVELAPVSMTPLPSSSFAFGLPGPITREAICAEILRRIQLTTEEAAP